MEKIALIDADILLYKFSHRNETETDWGNDVVSKHITYDKAIAELKDFLVGLRERLKVSEVRMVFSGADNFRYTVDPTYKHNRVDRPPSELRDMLKTYITDSFWTTSKHTLEGDDVLGIISTMMPDRFIVCSIDKDMLQVPGTHYNWNKDKLSIVTPEEGRHWFLTQILAGDSGDGYPGCPGIGYERAAEFLAAPFKMIPYEHTFKSGKRKGLVETRFKKELCDDVWEGIVSLYEWKGLNEEAAIKQARMARILTKELWEGQYDRMIPWSPAHLKD